ETPSGSSTATCRSRTPRLTPEPRHGLRTAREAARRLRAARRGHARKGPWRPHRAALKRGGGRAVWTPGVAWRGLCASLDACIVTERVAGTGSGAVKSGSRPPRPLLHSTLGGRLVGGLISAGQSGGLGQGDGEPSTGISKYRASAPRI